MPYVESTTEFRFKNLFNDAVYQGEVALRIKPDKFEDEDRCPDPVGYIKSIKLGNSEIVKEGPIPVRSDKTTTVPVQIRLDENEETTFSMKIEMWSPVGADMTASPARMAVQYNMELVSECNNLGGKKARILVDETEIPLSYGVPYQFDEMTNVEPGETIFQFRFKEPT